MFCGSLYVLFLLAIVLFVLLRYADSDCPCGIFKLFDNRRHNGLLYKVFRCNSYCNMCFVVTFLVTSVVFGTVVVACVSIAASVVLGTVVVKSLLFQQLLV